MNDFIASKFMSQVCFHNEAMVENLFSSHAFAEHEIPVSAKIWSSGIARMIYSNDGRAITFVRTKFDSSLFESCSSAFEGNVASFTADNDSRLLRSWHGQIISKLDYNNIHDDGIA